jgi:integrase
VIITRYGDGLPDVSESARSELFAPPSSLPVSKMFLRRVRGYGLERLTLHGLRHTWATLALDGGIHPRVVPGRFGHSTISITLGMYSHVGPTLHDEAVEAVASLFML